VRATETGRRVIPTGSVVIVKPPASRVRRTGLVVGPDQQFFPRPQSLFVQVGARTVLIAVTDLEVVPERGGTGAEGREQSEGDR